MRLAVIFTGGTILSTEQNGFLSPGETRKQQLISLIGAQIEVTVLNPYTILSEQLDGRYLTTLIKTVGSALSEGFDGILVLHGTDTLQYSAAALSLAFGDCAAPVVLVSSNYILDDPRSNGRENVHYAIEFIRQKIGGVYVSYKNIGARPEIHPGSAILPHNPYSGDICSLGGCFGYFEDERFVLNERPESDKSEPIGEYTLSTISPVLYLRACAGFNPPTLPDCRAVLIEAYHSGTLPTENRDFRDFCKSSIVPVYVVGVPDEIRYSSTSCYDELGLRILPPISPIFAYIMLWQRFS